MKAKIESSGSNASLGGVCGGKVHKAKYLKNQKDETNSAEIQAYLNKLQEMVPIMPKNKRLSKVEVISNVISYICQLRESLGLPPQCHSDVEDFEMEAMMLGHFSDKAPETTHSLGVTVTVINSKESASNNMDTTLPVQNRLPLCVLSNQSNTNVVNTSAEEVNDASKSV